MNRNEFNRFIAGGAVPGPGDLEGIREMTTLFPWFHSAHMILLRGLKENSDVRFDTQLRDSALFISDREVLYHYLYMPAPPSVPEEATAILPEAVPQAEVPEELIPGPEAPPEEVIESEQPVAVESPRPEQPAPDEVKVRTREELIAEIEARLAELASMPETTPVEEVYVQEEPEAPAISYEKESEQIEEEVMEFIPDTEPAIAEAQQKISPADLIDRFIRSNPTIERLSPGESQLVRDLSESSALEQGTFITETLAKIYLNQGYYTKAINIYEKLSLQYPEKSAYFASRIEKIRELIK